jgi:hypothetical protein
VTVTKTANETGRYTVTVDTGMVILGIYAAIEGAADAAYTKDKGLVPFARGVADNTGYVQFTKSVDSTGAVWADTEVEDGAKIRLMVRAKTGA